MSATIEPLPSVVSASPGETIVTPGAAEMEEENWEDGRALCLAVFINGAALQSRDARGERIIGDSFLLLLNASADAVPFMLPASRWAASWAIELDAADPSRGR